MSKAIIVLMFAIALTSCEGMIEPHGYVYDKTDRMPIDSVEAILILETNDTIRLEDSKGMRIRSFSNDSGYFTVSSGLIGMATGYPGYSVLLIKNGYKPLDIKKTGDSIFLEKK